VKYQDQDEFGRSERDVSFSSLALERWLQVTLPLTALTLLVAWSTYKMYDSSRNGMTMSERIADIFDSTKATSSTPTIQNEAHVQPQAAVWMGGGSTDGRVWHSARLLSTFLKPIRAHTRWTRQKESPLPLHDLGNAKSGP
jgi:hypothetical protein